MLRLLFSCLLLLPFGIFSQEYFIDWGIDNPRTSQLVSILTDTGSNFYAYRLSNNQFMQAPRVTRYVGGEAIIHKKIEQRIGNNTVLLEQLVTFNGTLLGFMSDKRDGINSLYMVHYDTEIDPLGDPVIITSYPMPKGWSNKGFFNVISSKNKKFLCLEYVIPGKRDLFDRYGYKVIDHNYKTVSEGEYEIPYNVRNASVDLRHLTDGGDYILGISVYKNANTGLWKDYTSLEKTVVVHVQNSEFEEYELNIDGKRVFDIGVSSMDSLLIVTGTYGDKNSSGSEGVFMQHIDLRRQRVVNEYFDLFPREFMTQELTGDQIERLERREERGRGGMQLMNYAIRAIHPMEDGSTIVVAEQYYIFQQSSTDARGSSQTVFHYYFNDIIAFKIDEAGIFNWIVRMPKEQHSINDYGYFSSTRTMISNGKLLCFFNDNRRNYDEAGEFTDASRSITFPVRKKSYALALGEIDLQTGEITRRVFNEYSETNGVVILKLSPIDYNNRQFLLVSTGRTERFGLMKF